MATKASGPGKAQRKGTSGGRYTERGSSVQSARYTPPVPKSVKVSPRWMGPAIIALFVLGVVVVILDYAALIPGGVNDLWLIAAVACIFAGLMLATRYH